VNRSCVDRITGSSSVFVIRFLASLSALYHEIITLSSVEYLYDSVCDSHEVGVDTDSKTVYHYNHVTVFGFPWRLGSWDAAI